MIKSVAIKLVSLNLINLIVATPMLTTSCSNVTNQKNENNNDDVEDNYDDPNLFFPKVYIEDYYDYVEMDNKGNLIIGDKFIMKVIKDVVSRVSTNKGEIEFSVEKYSNSSIDIVFKWKYLNKNLFKTYSFEIK